MLALSLRVSQHPFLSDRKRSREIINGLTDAAWNLLVAAYASMEVDELYFQGLCLLAQVDFAGTHLLRMNRECLR